MFLSVIFCVGYLTSRYKIFPYNFLDRHLAPRLELALEFINPPYPPQRTHMTYVPKPLPKPRIDKTRTYPGTVVFSTIKHDNHLALIVIDADGETLQEWDLDWFKLFPTEEDRKHIPERRIPKELPGGHVQGMQMLDNGDIIFKITHGLIRMNPCGKIVWKINERVHHTVFRDDNDILWVPTETFVTEPTPEFPRFKTVLLDQKILKVTLDGKILEYMNLNDILKKNQLESLNVLTSKTPIPTEQGDFFHLNDIETFPKNMEEGFFKHGDFMMSFRHTNMILVFDKDQNIKKIFTGDFIRQHDPDFYDGNTITLFDNHNTGRYDENGESQILSINAVTGETKTIFKGSKEEPFFSFYMGEHQWLPNGNLFITESAKGRLFEIDSQGKVVWEYYNPVKDNFIGRIDKAKKIDSKFSKEFFSEKRKSCEVNTTNP